MKYVLDPTSSRAYRSRYSFQLRHKWLGYAAGGVGLISYLSGAYLLFEGNPSGWAAMAPATFLTAVWLWYKGDLENIRAGKYKTEGRLLLHEALEPDTLARLHGSAERFSAYDLWKALEPSEERYFLHNRYGVDENYFEKLLSRVDGSASTVWETAAALLNKHEADGLTNALMLVALVKSVPESEKIFRASGLEINDLETAIPWMADIKTKRKLARSKKHFGGIGRDWAYGYTPILRHLGHNISEDIQQYGFFSDTSMHEPIVTRMAQIIGSSNSTVTLVGEEGVGKTTCVHAFAERLLSDQSLPAKIRFSQVVELNASTLLAIAKRQGELEELMLHIINEAHRAKNIILFFDESHVFFGSGTGSIDLSHVLQPVLESAGVRMIFAMNPKHWQELASSGAAARLTPVNVAPADEDNTLAILRDQIGVLEYRNNIVFTYESMQEAYKLGSRYVSTQAMPGAALAVLHQAATDTDQPLVTRRVIQQSVEKTYGIKLQTADDTEASNLINLEDELRKQVISQERAVKVVANALRRSRSGVGNPDRPVGTFLFLGPTGVGKTELSKALARTYFGNESALIRVDMNQYVSAGDVKRLTMSVQGSELGFLGEVRKQPFSVILLDEIEKAHTSVVNALLQMLDEGMMRDSDNKTVSFRDAIVIATSNAGADEIRRFIEEGQDLAKLEKTFTDTLIERGAFAPEFVNRFDEVVLFKPLQQDDLVQVIDLIVRSINNTLESQKVRVELSDAAKQWLVGKGYDSKLGARPMRRMAQRYVENTVAKKLLEKSVQPGGVVRLDVADLEALEK